MFTLFFKKIGRVAACVLTIAVLPTASYAQGNTNLAPGFTVRPAISKLLILPADVELFSIGGGGVREPKADWTQSAIKHFKAGLEKRKDLLGANVADLADKDVDEVAEINSLHGAVAQSVFLHHVMSVAKLPTKAGVLDWSLGDAVKPLKVKTGADYALFVWIRDSYATAERKAAMVAMALLRVGIEGGSQVGYASLVDLNDGRIVWFNSIRRATGDMREAEPALETVDVLLKGFPASK